jgi:outer membrane lipoprotein-sorting protein
MAALRKCLGAGRECSSRRTFPPGFRALGLLLICFLPAVTLAAGGNVLTGPHILELMVQALSNAQSLRVEQTVVVEDKAVADHPLELTETLSYAFPDRYRSDTRYKETDRIHVVAQGQALTVIDGRRTSDATGRFDRYKDLLLYRSRSMLHKILLSHGVDVGKTSLGRSDDRIVYVIGAQYPDMSSSQVWVDKERFLPMRWLQVSPTDPNDQLEFVYSDWQKKGDLWYPLQIETIHNQILIRRIRVTQIQVNVSLAPDLFDLPRLMDTYPQDAPAGTSPPPDSDASQEVQQTIEEFRKKFGE